MIEGVQRLPVAVRPQDYRRRALMHGELDVAAHWRLSILRNNSSYAWLLRAAETGSPKQIGFGSTSSRFTNCRMFMTEGERDWPPFELVSLSFCCVFGHDNCVAAIRNPQAVALP
jgi:hypothetical protein